MYSTSGGLDIESFAIQVVAPRIQIKKIGHDWLSVRGEAYIRELMASFFGVPLLEIRTTKGVGGMRSYLPVPDSIAC
jgi:hypothetical protein